MSEQHVSVAGISPAPTDAETAAIVAAIEGMWPKPVVAAPSEALRRPAWRFSGRWWAAPLPHRRDRPFR